MLNLGVVAADHSPNATNGTALDCAKQGIERAAQSAHDGLNREAHHAFGLDVGDMDLGGISVLVVQNRCLNYLFGGLKCCLLMNSMCVAPGNLALGDVEMNFVWKQPASAPRAGMMHCMSTTMASTAPVATASSCCRKFPATGTPVAHEHLISCAAHA